MTSNNDYIVNYSPNPIMQPTQSMHASVREIVTVFWDYENCPCPMSTKLASLTKEIKRRIDGFIGKKINKRIQLYCPMQRLHQRTRENATDLGILTMDVASKRKQESVDKRIIADIGLFATELAESSGNDIGHIVLISGDSDYGYILARLRDKSYIGKVIIFINDYTKETLTQHADYTHCLFQSNLTRKENPFSDYNQRKIPSNTNKMGYHNNNNHNRMNNNIGMNNNNNRMYGQSYHNSPYNGYIRNNFQLNDTASGNNNQQQGQQWTTTYPNFQYNNNNNTNGNMNQHTTPDYSHTLRGISKSSSSLPRSRSNGQVINNHNPGSFSSTVINNGIKRSGSPGGVRYTQNTVKILKKENKNKSEINNNNNNESKNNGNTYVYRKKKEKISHISDRDNNNNDNKNDIIAPPPIAPPTPSKLVKSSSKSSANSATSNKSKSASDSHRIVSQENLEEQLKQAQKEARSNTNNNNNNNKNGSLSSTIINDYKTNSAEIDGICNKNDSSTFPVGSLYKINECNDDKSNNKNKNKNISPLKPNKLNFDTFNNNKNNTKNNTNLSNDFFNSLAPNSDDMSQLLKSIAPNKAILNNKNKKLIFEPKTDHIINLKQIQPKTTTTATTIKKKDIKINNNNSNNNTTAISDQLRLVWNALSYCQKNSNNTPRRRDIYLAMKSMYPDFMVNKDQQFTDECIDACLSYGTVEEMIKGRIQSLFILPVVLNALTSKDSQIYSKSKSNKSDNYITLNQLLLHLKSRYTNHLSTYFTLTYLYRIISNPTRLFAFHKDDKHKNYEILNDNQLGKLRFRVRKGAYNAQQKQNTNSYNQYNNNLTFNYYHS